MKTTPYQSNPFVSSFNGFGKIFKYSQTAAIVILVVSSLGLLFQIIPTPGSDSSSSDPIMTSSSSSVSGLAVIAILIGIVAAIAIGLFISVVFSGIVNYVAYKTSKEEPTTIGEAFKVTMSRFWSIAYALIVSWFKIVGGLLLLIVPGIRASLRYQMVLLPLFDENLSGSAALKRIKFLTKDHLIEMFGLYTVASLIFPITTLLQMGGHAIMYPQLKDIKDNNKEKPKVHWLNYLGFLLILFWVVLVSLIIAVVAAIASN